MLSIIWVSTAFLANRLRDHFAKPLGALLQAKAIIRASTSPVIFGLTGGVLRFFFVEKIQCLQLVKIFFLLCQQFVCCNCFLLRLCLSVLTFLLFDSSNVSMILACLRSLALCTPFVANFSKCWRSSLVSFIVFIM